MPFLNENVANRLPKNAPFQVGRSDRDSGREVEADAGLLYVGDPVGSFRYFECQVGVMLDSGIVVHNQLPQVNNAPDTLAATDLDSDGYPFVTNLGVSLKCKDQYADIVQRMGHARYWFRIWGRAARVGYQVPIPGIRTIGGVPAIPYDKNPQWACNSIVPGGNFGGVIMWRAEWSLWYTTAVPPTSSAIPAADPTAQVVGSPDPPPAEMEVPVSLPDDSALR
jgi:hypothetical protein